MNYVNEDRELRQNINLIFKSNFNRPLLESFFQNNFSDIHYELIESIEKPNYYTYELNRQIYSFFKDEKIGLLKVLDELKKYDKYVGYNAYDKNAEGIIKLFKKMIEYRNECENFNKKDDDSFTKVIKDFELLYLMDFYSLKKSKYEEVYNCLNNKPILNQYDKDILENVIDDLTHVSRLYSDIKDVVSQNDFSAKVGETQNIQEKIQELRKEDASYLEKRMKKLIELKVANGVQKERYDHLKAKYNDLYPNQPTLEIRKDNPNLETEDGKIIKLLDKVKYSICSITAKLSIIPQFGGSQGSGWYIGNNRVITNAHVISNMNPNQPMIFDIIECDFVKITKKYSVIEIEKIDMEKDIAILKIKEDEYIRPHSITIAAGDGDIIEGMKVYTYGNPLSKGVQFSEGRITMVSDELFPKFIRTNMPINSGNSGGPLFNSNGQVIGMVTAVHSNKTMNHGFITDKENDEEKEVEIKTIKEIDNFSLAIRIEEIKKLL